MEPLERERERERDFSINTVKLVLSDHVRAKQIWSLNGGGL